MNVSTRPSLVRPSLTGEITRAELDDRLAHALAGALVAWARRHVLNDAPAAGPRDEAKAPRSLRPAS